MHIGCFYVVNIFCTSSWMDFTLLYLGRCSLHLLTSETVYRRENAYLVRFFVLVFSGFIFSLNEKVRKELFVIAHTQTKSKKQMMQFFDSSNPKAIVSKDGAIQLFNSNFEAIFEEQFKLKHVP